jgi:very-short-patch-repair endonuclease
MNDLIQKYTTLSDEDKLRVLKYYYTELRLSWREIAKLSDTYTQKLVRDATRLGIPSRTKSEAQSVAIDVGRSEHRTKGKSLPESTKLKISQQMGGIWDSLSEEEREYRKQIGKDTWNALSPEEQQYRLDARNQGIHKASREGSKLEKFLLKSLTKAGYKVLFHREHMLRNINLHIDIVLPDLRTAIEVDGPSHHSPVWGEERYQKTVATDKQKTGLVLAENLCLIRIKQTQSTITQRYKREVLSNLLDVLYQIGVEFPPEGKRYFEI